MAQKTRRDDILDILKKQGYASVKYLMEELHYSSATINRDLNLLEKQKLVKRSYGGVELAKHRSTPLVFRYHKMRVEKNRIGKEAAKYIEDGDTIFIDASTTGQYIGQYITNRKNLTVISNNMALLSFLSEYGIRCICLGGTVVEIPSMLSGDQTVFNARSYTVDKMFFATGGITEDGKILSDNTYYLLHMTVAENAKKIFYLADRGKVHEADTQRLLFDASRLDYVISDHAFPAFTLQKFARTSFICVHV